MNSISICTTLVLILFSFTQCSAQQSTIENKRDNSKSNASGTNDIEPTKPKFYQGTSDKGDVSDAISKAANEALQNNPTFVKWELVRITCVRGGFIEANKVTAVIKIFGKETQTEPHGDEIKTASYSERLGSNNNTYIKLISATDDLATVIVSLSNWRHTQNWSVSNGSPLVLRSLPSVGYGVAVFNPNYPQRRALGGDSFQLAVPYEITVSGSAGNFKL
jgi:hypothetical protein